MQRKSLKLDVLACDNEDKVVMFIPASYKSCQSKEAQPKENSHIAM